MILLQINTVVNSGSTGRIAEDIGVASMNAGYKSYIAAGVTGLGSRSEVITIGNDFDRKLHGIKSFITDRHGFGSEKSTRNLIRQIAVIKPDIVHLHNLHGYYLHIGLLFDYLKQVQTPVVWTLHDCWPFTGHCSFFDRVNCNKWQSECNSCPNLRGYPASYGLDQSKRNFRDKNQLFNGIKSMRIVTPSAWLSNHVQHSFLSDYPVQVIHNGVNLATFKPQINTVEQKYGLNDKPIILGVASTWDKRKGLDDFIELSQLVKGDAQIVLIGLSKEQVTTLPSAIKGISRTENMEELAALYGAAAIFVNPTYVDNFPTTNIEALACGTPVITYNTGGSPEAIDANTGFVVEKGNVKMLYEKIQFILAKGKDYYSQACRNRAVEYFNKDDRYNDYLQLYKNLLTGANGG